MVGWCGVVGMCFCYRPGQIFIHDNQVCGVCSVWSISQTAADPDAIFAMRAGQWIVSFYSLTLATNLIATGERCTARNDPDVHTYQRSSHSSYGRRTVPYLSCASTEALLGLS